MYKSKTDPFVFFISFYFKKIIADYISRTMTPVSPSPSKSSSHFNLSAVRSHLPRLRSGFFQHATSMEWLDDKNIFTWGGNKKNSINGHGSQETLDVNGDDGYFSWSRLTSRNGSQNSTPFRSRSNSFSMTSSSEHPFSMTSLSTTTATTTSHQQHDNNNNNTSDHDTSSSGAYKRPTFRIEDVDSLKVDEGYADDNGLEIRKKI